MFDHPSTAKPFHRRQRPGLRRISFLFAVLLTAALGVTQSAPAQATTTFEKYTNWSGLAGKPIGLRGYPVVLVTMFFDIPVVDCKKKEGSIAIWAGMDTAPNTPLDQAGLQGTCTKGSSSPEWHGWFEAFPAVDTEQPIPGLAGLHAGQHVIVSVEYRPDLASDAFVASFQVRDATSVKTVSKTFYSPSGARSRNRAECIVERPVYGYKKGVAIQKPIPYFHNANGKDFTAFCMSGDHVHSLSEMTGGPGTDNDFIDLYAPYGTFTFGHLLVRARSGDGLIQWHWVASK